MTRLDGADGHQGWRLLREVGIERHSAEPLGLVQPVSVVAGGETGGYLVVDRQHDRDRVWRVGADGGYRHFGFEGLYSSSSRVRSVNPAASGWTVVAGHSPREVVAVDPDGVVSHRYVDTSKLPDGLGTPMSAWQLDDGVVICDQGTRERPGGLVTLDRSGRLIWQWRELPFEELVDLTVFENLLLLTDTARCTVVAVDFGGSVRWTFGQPGRPHEGHDRLSTPWSTSTTATGTVLLADSRNDRIVELSGDGEFVRSWESKRDAAGARLGPFCHPLTAIEVGAGRMAVADSGNARVVDVALSDPFPASPVRRLLSFPRSVQPRSTRPGNETLWLIADTNNDRVIEIDRSERVVWQYGAGVPSEDAVLRWPRCANRRGDLVLICDGLNGRVIAVGGSGELVWEISQLKHQQDIVPLRDPHDIRNTFDGGLLLTDAAANIVAKLDADLEVRWIFGTDDGSLRDPHQAHGLPDGGALIVHADGLVVVDADGQLTRVVREIQVDGCAKRLKGVKAYLPLDDGTALLCGTFSGAPGLLVVEAELTEGVSVSELSESADAEQIGEDRLRFHHPRWIELDTDGTVLISDYASHRIAAASPQQPSQS